MTIVRSANSTMYNTPRLETNQLLGDPLLLNLESGWNLIPNTLPPQVRTTGNNVYYMYGPMVNPAGAAQDDLIATIPTEAARIFAATGLGIRVPIVETSGGTFVFNSLLILPNGEIRLGMPVGAGNNIFFDGIVYVGNG